MSSEALLKWVPSLSSCELLFLSTREQYMDAQRQLISGRSTLAAFIEFIIKFHTPSPHILDYLLYAVVHHYLFWHSIDISPQIVKILATLNYIHPNTIKMAEEKNTYLTQFGFSEEMALLAPKFAPSDQFDNPNIIRTPTYKLNTVPKYLQRAAYHLHTLNEHFVGLQSVVDQLHSMAHAKTIAASAPVSDVEKFLSHDEINLLTQIHYEQQRLVGLLAKFIIGPMSQGGQCTGSDLERAFKATLESLEPISNGEGGVMMGLGNPPVPENGLPLGNSLEVIITIFNKVRNEQHLLQKKANAMQYEEESRLIEIDTKNKIDQMFVEIANLRTRQLTERLVIIDRNGNPLPPLRRLPDGSLVQLDTEIDFEGNVVAKDITKTHHYGLKSIKDFLNEVKKAPISSGTDSDGIQPQEGSHMALNGDAIAKFISQKFHKMVKYDPKTDRWLIPRPKSRSTSTPLDGAELAYVLPPVAAEYNGPPVEINLSSPTPPPLIVKLKPLELVKPTISKKLTPFWKDVGRAKEAIRGLGLEKRKIRYINTSKMKFSSLSCFKPLHVPYITTFPKSSVSYDHRTGITTRELKRTRPLPNGIDNIWQWQEKKREEKKRQKGIKHGTTSTAMVNVEKSTVMGDDDTVVVKNSPIIDVIQKLSPPIRSILSSKHGLINFLPVTEATPSGTTSGNFSIVEGTQFRTRMDENGATICTKKPKRPFNPNSFLSNPLLNRDGSLPLRNIFSKPIYAREVIEYPFRFVAPFTQTSILLQIALNPLINDFVYSYYSPPSPFLRRAYSDHPTPLIDVDSVIDRWEDTKAFILELLHEELAYMVQKATKQLASEGLNSISIDSRGHFDLRRTVQEQFGFSSEELDRKDYVQSEIQKDMLVVLNSALTHHFAEIQKIPSWVQEKLHGAVKKRPEKKKKKGRRQNNNQNDTSVPLNLEDSEDDEDEDASDSEYEPDDPSLGTEPNDPREFDETLQKFQSLMTFQDTVANLDTYNPAKTLTYLPSLLTYLPTVPQTPYAIMNSVCFDSLDLHNVITELGVIFYPCDEILDALGISKRTIFKRMRQNEFLLTLGFTAETIGDVDYHLRSVLDALPDGWYETSLLVKQMATFLYLFFELYHFSSRYRQQLFETTETQFNTYLTHLEKQKRQRGWKDYCKDSDKYQSFYHYLLLNEVVGHGAIPAALDLPTDYQDGSKDGLYGPGGVDEETEGVAENQEYWQRMQQYEEDFLDLHNYGSPRKIKRDMAQLPDGRYGDNPFDVESDYDETKDGPFVPKRSQKGSKSTKGAANSMADGQDDDLSSSGDDEYDENDGDGVLAQFRNNYSNYPNYNKRTLKEVNLLKSKVLAYLRNKRASARLMNDNNAAPVVQSQVGVINMVRRLTQSHKNKIKNLVIKGVIDPNDDQGALAKKLCRYLLPKKPSKGAAKAKKTTKSSKRSKKSRKSKTGSVRKTAQAGEVQTGQTAKTAKTTKGKGKVKKSTKSTKSTTLAKGTAKTAIKPGVETTKPPKKASKKTKPLKSALKTARKAPSTAKMAKSVKLSHPIKTVKAIPVGQVTQMGQMRQGGKKNVKGAQKRKKRKKFTFYVTPLVATTTRDLKRRMALYAMAENGARNVVVFKKGTDTIKARYSMIPCDVKNVKNGPNGQNGQEDVEKGLANVPKAYKIVKHVNNFSRPMTRSEKVIKNAQGSDEGQSRRGVVAEQCVSARDPMLVGLLEQLQFGVVEKNYQLQKLLDSNPLRSKAALCAEFIAAHAMHENTEIINSQLSDLHINDPLFKKRMLNKSSLNPDANPIATLPEHHVTLTAGMKRVPVNCYSYRSRYPHNYVLEVAEENLHKEALNTMDDTPRGPRMQYPTKKAALMMPVGGTSMLEHSMNSDFLLHFLQERQLDLVKKSTYRDNAIDNQLMYEHLKKLRAVMDHSYYKNERKFEMQLQTAHLTKANGTVLDGKITKMAQNGPDGAMIDGNIGLKLQQQSQFEGQQNDQNNRPGTRNANLLHTISTETHTPSPFNPSHDPATYDYANEYIIEEGSVNPSFYPSVLPSLLQSEPYPASGPLPPRHPGPLRTSASPYGPNPVTIMPEIDPFGRKVKHNVKRFAPGLSGYQMPFNFKLFTTRSIYDVAEAMRSDPGLVHHHKLLSDTVEKLCAALPMGNQAHIKALEHRLGLFMKSITVAPGAGPLIRLISTFTGKFTRFQWLDFLKVLHLFNVGVITRSDMLCLMRLCFNSEQQYLRFCVAIGVNDYYDPMVQQTFHRRVMQGKYTLDMKSYSNRVLIAVHSSTKTPYLAAQRNQAGVGSLQNGLFRYHMAMAANSEVLYRNTQRASFINKMEQVTNKYHTWANSQQISLLKLVRIVYGCIYQVQLTTRMLENRNGTNKTLFDEPIVIFPPAKAPSEADFAKYQATVEKSQQLDLPWKNIEPALPNLLFLKLVSDYIPFVPMVVSEEAVTTGGADQKLMELAESPISPANVTKATKRTTIVQRGVLTLSLKEFVSCHEANVLTSIHNLHLPLNCDPDGSHLDALMPFGPMGSGGDLDRAMGKFGQNDQNGAKMGRNAKNNHLMIQNGLKFIQSLQNGAINPQTGLIHIQKDPNSTQRQQVAGVAGPVVMSVEKNLTKEEQKEKEWEDRISDRERITPLSLISDTSLLSDDQKLLKTQEELARRIRNVRKVVKEVKGPLDEIVMEQQVFRKKQFLSKKDRYRPLATQEYMKSTQYPIEHSMRLIESLDERIMSPFRFIGSDLVDFYSFLKSFDVEKELPRITPSYYLFPSHLEFPSQSSYEFVQRGELIEIQKEQEMYEEVATKIWYQAKYNKLTAAFELFQGQLNNNMSQLAAFNGGEPFTGPINQIVTDNRTTTTMNNDDNQSNNLINTNTHALPITFSNTFQLDYSDPTIPTAEHIFKSINLTTIKLKELTAFTFPGLIALKRRHAIQRGLNTTVTSTDATESPYITFDQQDYYGKGPLNQHLKAADDYLNKHGFEGPGPTAISTSKRNVPAKGAAGRADFDTNHEHFLPMSPNEQRADPRVIMLSKLGNGYPYSLVDILSNSYYVCEPKEEEVVLNSIADMITMIEKKKLRKDLFKMAPNQGLMTPNSLSYRITNPSVSDLPRSFLGKAVVQGLESKQTQFITSMEPILLRIKLLKDRYSHSIISSIIKQTLNPRTTPYQRAMKVINEGREFVAGEILKLNMLRAYLKRLHTSLSLLPGLTARSAPLKHPIPDRYIQMLEEIYERNDLIEALHIAPWSTIPVVINRIDTIILCFNQLKSSLLYAWGKMAVTTHIDIFWDPGPINSPPVFNLNYVHPAIMSKKSLRLQERYQRLPRVLMDEVRDLCFLLKAMGQTEQEVSIRGQDTMQSNGYSLEIEPANHAVACKILLDTASDKARNLRNLRRKFVKNRIEGMGRDGEYMSLEKGLKEIIPTSNAFFDCFCPSDEDHDSLFEDEDAEAEAYYCSRHKPTGASAQATSDGDTIAAFKAAKKNRNDQNNQKLKKKSKKSLSSNNFRSDRLLDQKMDDDYNDYIPGSDTHSPPQGTTIACYNPLTSRSHKRSPFCKECGENDDLALLDMSINPLQETGKLHPLLTPQNHQNPASNAQFCFCDPNIEYIASYRYHYWQSQRMRGEGCGEYQIGGVDDSDSNHFSQNSSKKPYSSFDKPAFAIQSVTESFDFDRFGSPVVGFTPYGADTFTHNFRGGVGNKVIDQNLDNKDNDNNNQNNNQSLLNDSSPRPLNTSLVKNPFQYRLQIPLMQLSAEEHLALKGLCSLSGIPLTSFQCILPEDAPLHHNLFTINNIIPYTQTWFDYNEASRKVLFANPHYVVETRGRSLPENDPTQPSESTKTTDTIEKGENLSMSATEAKVDPPSQLIVPTGHPASVLMVGSEDNHRFTPIALNSRVIQVPSLRQFHEMPAFMTQSFVSQYHSQREKQLELIDGELTLQKVVLLHQETISQPAHFNHLLALHTFHSDRYHLLSDAITFEAGWGKYGIEELHENDQVQNHIQISTTMSETNQNDTTTQTTMVLSTQNDPYTIPETLDDAHPMVVLADSSQHLTPMVPLNHRHVMHNNVYGGVGLNLRPGQGFSNHGLQSLHSNSTLNHLSPNNAAIHCVHPTRLDSRCGSCVGKVRCQEHYQVKYKGQTSAATHWLVLSFIAHQTMALPNCSIGMLQTILEYVVYVVWQQHLALGEQMVTLGLKLIDHFLFQFEQKYRQETQLYVKLLQSYLVRNNRNIVRGHPSSQYYNASLDPNGTVDPDAGFIGGSGVPFDPQSYYDFDEFYLLPGPDININTIPGTTSETCFDSSRIPQVRSHHHLYEQPFPAAKLPSSLSFHPDLASRYDSMLHDVIVTRTTPLIKKNQGAVKSLRNQKAEGNNGYPSLQTPLQTQMAQQFKTNTKLIDKYNNLNNHPSNYQSSAGQQFRPSHFAEEIYEDGPMHGILTNHSLNIYINATQQQFDLKRDDYPIEPGWDYNHPLSIYKIGLDLSQFGKKIENDISNEYSNNKGSHGDTSGLDDIDTSTTTTTTNFQYPKSTQNVPPVASTSRSGLHGVLQHQIPDMHSSNEAIAMAISKYGVKPNSLMRYLDEPAKSFGDNHQGNGMNDSNNINDAKKYQVVGLPTSVHAQPCPILGLLCSGGVQCSHRDNNYDGDVEDETDVMNQGTKNEPKYKSSTQSPSIHSFRLAITTPEPPHADEVDTVAYARADRNYTTVYPMITSASMYISLRLYLELYERVYPIIVSQAAYHNAGSNNNNECKLEDGINPPLNPLLTESDCVEAIHQERQYYSPTHLKSYEWLTYQLLHNKIPALLYEYECTALFGTLTQPLFFNFQRVCVQLCKQLYNMVSNTTVVKAIAMYDFFTLSLQLKHLTTHNMTQPHSAFVGLKVDMMRMRGGNEDGNEIMVNFSGKSTPSAQQAPFSSSQPSMVSSKSSQTTKKTPRKLIAEANHGLGRSANHYDPNKNQNLHLANCDEGHLLKQYATLCFYELKEDYLLKVATFPHSSITGIGYIDNILYRQCDGLQLPALHYQAMYQTVFSDRDFTWTLYKQIYINFLTHLRQKSQQQLYSLQTMNASVNGSKEALPTYQFNSKYHRLVENDGTLIQSQPLPMQCPASLVKKSRESHTLLQQLFDHYHALLRKDPNNGANNIINQFNPEDTQELVYKNRIIVFNRPFNEIRPLEKSSIERAIALSPHTETGSGENAFGIGSAGTQGGASAGHGSIDLETLGVRNPANVNATGDGVHADNIMNNTKKFLADDIFAEHHAKFTMDPSNIPNTLLMRPSNPSVINNQRSKRFRHQVDFTQHGANTWNTPANTTIAPAQRSKDKSAPRNVENEQYHCNTQEELETIALMAYLDGLYDAVSVDKFRTQAMAGTISNYFDKNNAQNGSNGAPIDGDAVTTAVSQSPKLVYSIGYVPTPFLKRNIGKTMRKMVKSGVTDPMLCTIGNDNTVFKYHTHKPKSILLNLFSQSNNENDPQYSEPNNELGQNDMTFHRIVPFEQQAQYISQVTQLLQTHSTRNSFANAANNCNVKNTRRYNDEEFDDEDNEDEDDYDEDDEDAVEDEHANDIYSLITSRIPHPSTKRKLGQNNPLTGVKLGFYENPMARAHRKKSRPNSTHPVIVEGYSTDGRQIDANFFIVGGAQRHPNAPFPTQPVTSTKSDGDEVVDKTNPLVQLRKLQGNTIHYPIVPKRLPTLFPAPAQTADSQVDQTRMDKWLNTLGKISYGIGDPSVGATPRQLLDQSAAFQNSWVSQQLRPQSFVSHGYSPILNNNVKVVGGANNLALQQQQSPLQQQQQQPQTTPSNQQAPAQLDPSIVAAPSTSLDSIDTSNEAPVPYQSTSMDDIE